MYVDEIHQPSFDCDIIFSINQLGEDVSFELKSVNFEISLDQWTRVSRCEVEPEYDDHEPDEPEYDDYEPDDPE